MYVHKHTHFAACLCVQEALIAAAVMKTAALISPLLEHSNTICRRERQSESGG